MVDSEFNEAKGNGSLLYSLNPQDFRRKRPKILGPHGRWRIPSVYHSRWNRL